MSRLWPLLALLTMTLAGCAEDANTRKDGDEYMVGASKINVGGPDAPKVEQAPPPSSTDPAESTD